MKLSRTNMVAVLLLSALAGCLSKIPLFDTKARTLNRIASAQEMLIETNNEVAQLRNAGFLTQASIDKTISPSLNKAEQIIKATRDVARGASPTTQPAGTIDDAKKILLSVRSILEQIRGPVHANPN